MIDERIVYEWLTLCNYVFAIYYLFFRKPEESFFAFEDECINPNITERRAWWQHLLLMSSILGVLLWAEMGEGSKMPAMLHEVHHTVKGQIVSLEAWEKSKRGYEVWSAKTYRLTIREADGTEVYLKETRAPELRKGETVEVRLYEADNLIPLITKVNGSPTKLALRDYPVTWLERTMVFGSYVLIAVLVWHSLRRQYVTLGGRAYGKGWYRISCLSVLLWIGMTWGCIFGKQYVPGSGTLLYWLYGWIHLCIFVMTWVANPEGARRLCGILFGRKYGMLTVLQEAILLKRCDEQDVTCYCAYKKKRLREDFWNRIGCVLLFLALYGAVDILWESHWKRIALPVLFLLACIEGLQIVRTWLPNRRALQLASTQGMECVEVPFFYGKKRVYRGTDGELLERRMRYDDDVDLEEGEPAIIFRVTGTSRTYIERKVVVQERIWKRQELFR